MQRGDFASSTTPLLVFSHKDQLCEEEIFCCQWGLSMQFGPLGNEGSKSGVDFCDSAYSLFKVKN